MIRTFSISFDHYLKIILINKITQRTSLKYIYKQFLCYLMLIFSYRYKLYKYKLYRWNKKAQK